MSQEEARELRRSPLARDGDLDAEAEVDLGRHAAAVATRWWLPAAGLLAGVLAGYALSLGGKDVFSAQALVYLGVPLAPNGGGQLQGLATNPAAVQQIVRSEAVVRRVASETGVAPSVLRGGTSVKAASTGTAAARGLAPSLVNVSVRGETPRVGAAANALARVVVRAVAGRYVDTKIAALETQIAQSEEELRAIDRQLDAAQAAVRGASASDRLAILTLSGQFLQRRSIVQQSLLDRRQLLSIARNIERSRIVQRAVPRETTARSRRNSVVVAGALGLLLGLVAALVWDAAAARARTAA